MPHSEIAEINETDDKRVCSDCLGEAYLKAHIQKIGEPNDYSYCDGNGQTIDIEQLADIIERAFEAHYVRTDTKPDGLEYAMQRDPEIEYEWEKSGDEVLWAVASTAVIGEATVTRHKLQRANLIPDSTFGTDSASFLEDSDSAFE
jgi:hypothetical protein